MLGSNLEDLDRLAGLVNDMLFLSKADRGERARRSPVGSLAALAAEVVEFHDAALQEAGISVRICGTAAVPSMRVCCGGPCRTSSPTRRGLRSADQRSIWTSSSTNLASACPSATSGRRFCRASAAPVRPLLSSRQGARTGDANHGLGLAIVAAIARMHGGDAFVRSSAGKTTVGFSLSAVAITTRAPARPEPTTSPTSVCAHG